MTVDRDTASRLGLTMYQIDNTLYDAFGQRSVSVIYNPLNQYRVVMEAAPQFWQRPGILDQIWVSRSGGAAERLADHRAQRGLGGGGAGRGPRPADRADERRR